MRTALSLTAATLALSTAVSGSAAAPTQTATPAPADDPATPRAPLPYDRGYDKPSARTDAINAANRANVAAANNAVLAGAEARDGANAAAQADAELRYEADLTEYRRELRAQRRADAIDAALNARQERAYADAMAAWRIQVADCRDGVRAACRAPSPRPADFW